MRKKILFGIIVSIFLVLSSLNLTIANDKTYFGLCLNEGETVRFSECNPGLEDRTCESDLCSFCVFIGSTGAYCPGGDKCNSEGSVCTGLGGGGNDDLDQTPPEMTVNLPVQDGIYNDKNILFDVETNELARVYYRFEGDDDLERICSSGFHCIDDERLEENLNEIFVVAIDDSGNKVETEISFFVDDEEPRIRDTEPDRGFASGVFLIEFDEMNPSLLTLHYGNGINGMREESFTDFESCFLEDGEEYTCEVEVDLEDYDGEEILYWFSLEDIAGSIDESNDEEVNVDITPPNINNPGSLFFVDGDRVYFSIDITEANLDEVGYIDNSDDKPKERKLCSRLDEGVCEKRVRFKHDGWHNVTIYVIDEVGFVSGEGVSFMTDGDDPKIKKTLPKNGDTNGKFYLEFEEVNVNEVFINYGNSLTGFRFDEVDVSTCVLDDEEYMCNLEVDLRDYHGQEIDYWFNITDLIGNSDESRDRDLDVDIVSPIINGPVLFEVDEDEVNIIINVTEENFDEAEYIVDNGTDPDAEWKRLCSRLDEGICEDDFRIKKLGNHTVGLRVIDDAGNVAEDSISVEIIEL